ncbi:hypothetical protein MMC31_006038, partial [Peltigera leucophlebia]|nr:hypothetical protein [Peltigera leucophlebia]
PYSDDYGDEEYPADDGFYLPPPEDDSNWNWFKPVPFRIPGDSGPDWNILRQLLTKDDITPNAPYLPSPG